MITLASAWWQRQDQRVRQRQKLDNSLGRIDTATAAITFTDPDSEHFDCGGTLAAFEQGIDFAEVAPIVVPFRVRVEPTH